MNQKTLTLAFWLVLFVISYAIVWAIGALWLSQWTSPLHFLVPIPAFFLTIWALQWSQEEFKLNTTSLWWPLLILVLGFSAFFVAQFFYWCNGLTDIFAANTTCSSEGASRTIELLAGQWMELLVRDGYFYFWIMIFLAWISLRILQLASPQPAKTRKKTG